MRGRRCVRPVFEPGALADAFRDVPWPDDAYRERAGRVQVRGSADRRRDASSKSWRRAWRNSMASAAADDLLPFDGALDPSSLPDEPAAT